MKNVVYRVSALCLVSFALQGMEKSIPQESNQKGMNSELKQFGAEALGNDADKAKGWNNVETEDDLNAFIREHFPEYNDGGSGQSTDDKEVKEVLADTMNPLIGAQKDMVKGSDVEKAQKLGGLLQKVKNLFKELDQKILDLAFKETVISHETLNTIDDCLLKIVNVLQPVIHIGRMIVEKAPALAAMPIVIGSITLPPLPVILMGISIACFAIMKLQQYVHSLRVRVGERLQGADLKEMQGLEKKAIVHTAKSVEVIEKCEESAEVSRSIDEILAHEELAPLDEEEEEVEYI